MVLALVDEDNPKCYMCHRGFESIEALREHQRSAHDGGPSERGSKREPAPGDVTVF